MNIFTGLNFDIRYIAFIILAAFAAHLMVILIMRQRKDERYNRNITINAGCRVESNGKRRKKSTVELSVDGDETVLVGDGSQGRG